MSESKPFQAYCHWCHDEIHAPNVCDVKTFWNHSWTGYPICSWCSKGLTTNGKKPMKDLRKELGLDKIEKRITLEKWLK